MKSLRLMAVVLAVFILAMGLGVASADYPEREIRLIVAFPAGGSTDIVARVVGEHLSKRLGQPVVVENRGGAGGTVGTRAAAKAKPDGYTLTVATTSTHIIGYLVHKPGYHPLNDFEPISLMAETPYVLIVRPDAPFKSLPDLIDYGRKNPGKLNMGSAGMGSTTHLAGEIFLDRVKVQGVHIPYDGNRPALTALMGGETHFQFISFPAGFAAMQAGQVKAIGVGTGRRMKQIADVPTVEEAAGLKGYRASLWLGLAAPAGTPQPVVKKLHETIRSLVEKDESVQQALRKNGAEPASSESPSEFHDYMKAELADYEPTVTRVMKK